ncbi:MAG: hypothetical protein ACU0BB_14205 [Paracoccaceae bacterium]
MAQLLLHIGGYKTGTTYLQSLFHLNRDRLLDAGICYPKNPPGQAHHGFAAHWVTAPDAQNAAKLGGGSRKLWHELLSQQPATTHTILLSSELFSHDDVDLIKLFELTDNFDDVTIIYTMRHQAELAQSIWLQLTRAGKRRSLHAFIRTALDHRRAGSVQLDHNAIYDRLARHFGPEQVRVLNYHQEQRRPGGIAQAILNHTGTNLRAESLTPPDAAQANISPDPLGYYMATQISEFPDDDLVKLTTQIARHGLAEGAKTSLLAHHEFIKFRSRFEHRNAALVQKLQNTQPGFSFEELDPDPDMIFRKDTDPSHWISLSKSLYQTTRRRTGILAHLLPSSLGKT